MSKLALVGCGAIAKSFYLPALSTMRSSFDAIYLVDPSELSLDAARRLVDGIPGRTFADLPADISHVIVASPNAAHFEHASEALRRGAHVLVEKPFVLWPEEGARIITLAAERGRIAAVNQTRRVHPLARELRARVRSGALGRLRSVVHNEGSKLDWPFTSGAAFAPAAQRTGVIMDLGVHVLDFYQYVLESAWTLRQARHDGFAGPEGLTQIELLAGDAPVSIRLSRYLRQDNLAVLSFEHADVVIRLYDWNNYTIRDGRKSQTLSAPSPIRTFPGLAQALITNFLAASRGEEPALCSAADALHTIALLDRIYQTAGHYPVAVGAA